MWYTAFVSGFEFGSLFLIGFWFVSYAWQRAIVGIPTVQVKRVEAAKVDLVPEPTLKEPEIPVQEEPETKTVRTLKTFGIRQLKAIASHLTGTPHSIGQYGQLNKPTLLQALIDRIDYVAQLGLAEKVFPEIWEG